MTIEAQTWFIIFALPALCAAGCSDSQAPAMTQAADRSTEPAAAPRALSASAKSKAASSNTASSESASDAANAGEIAPVPSPIEPQEAATALEKPATDTSKPAEPPSASERLRDISFDDLKFDMKKGDPFERSLLTDKIDALGGKRVRIRGFILPSFQQTGLTQFVLVRDNLSCCFGPGAAIYDCVIVEMKPGHSTDYSLYPVAVDGTFTIREMLDPDGKAVAIYHLDGEQVR